jgi:multidrug efflux pump subunit AcrA (membrane-fusion protein)
MRQHSGHSLASTQGRWSAATAAWWPARPWPRRTLWVALAGALLGLLVVAGVARVATTQQEVIGEAPSAASKLISRGQVRPVAQAKVGTLAGGRVLQLGVQIGDAVLGESELARVRGPDGTVEVLTAPWGGRVTGLPVHEGDTVMPGTTVVTIGDLSQLQIETTEVDEFLIPYVYPGQIVRLTVDALDRRELQARVRTVTLEPQTTASGDEHYPVILDLVGPVPGLRPGMTVRVDFTELPRPRNGATAARQGAAAG